MTPLLPAKPTGYGRRVASRFTRKLSPAEKQGFLASLAIWVLAMVLWAAAAAPAASYGRIASWVAYVVNAVVMRQRIEREKQQPKA